MRRYIVGAMLMGVIVTVARFPLALYLSRTRGLGGIGITWAINGTLIAQAMASAVLNP